jgi:hypothetical protein
MGAPFLKNNTTFTLARDISKLLRACKGDANLFLTINEDVPKEVLRSASNTDEIWSRVQYGQMVKGNQVIGQIRRVFLYLFWYDLARKLIPGFPKYGVLRKGSQMTLLQTLERERSNTARRQWLNTQGKDEIPYFITLGGRVAHFCDEFGEGALLYVAELFKDDL